ncbi:MAG: isochorismatase family cysteine hydrolase, partial [Candidatus Jordarchaeales archaeon]
LKYDGFLGTALDLVLSSRKIDSLIVTGVLTNICVLYTASTASMLGYNVTVVRDCVASTSDKEHEWALHHMGDVIGIKIASLEEVLASL